jgi:hypothetical protein
MSDLLDTYGGEVPLIGPFLQAYGQVTNAMLGSLDRLSQNFDEVVRQSHVGGETSTLVPHRNKVLFNQKPDGETVFREFLYATCGPSYAYKPVGTEPNTESRVLLWDESADYWYVIKHPVRVERVYADHLLIGIDLTPAKMARQLRQDIYQKSMQRRNQAERLFEFLNKGIVAIAQCASAEASETAIHKLDLFRARFTYSPEHPVKVQAMMRQWFDCLCKNGHADAAANVRTHAVAAGFDDAKQWQCQTQGPWTVKLRESSIGYNPDVHFTAHAVIHSSGQVDFVCEIKKVEPFVPLSEGS